MADKIRFIILVLWASGFTLIQSFGMAAEKTSSSPIVRVTTNLGVMEIELDPQRAPLSSANFLKYVDRGFYNGTVFHRVIPGFMIQGGGFQPGLKEKPTDTPVRNEADNGLKNLKGTIAMARTPDPDSATAQFFINAADNDFLNHRSKTPQGWGYAVFGKVTQGLDVVKQIESVQTKSVGPYDNVPDKDVVIQKVERIN